MRRRALLTAVAGAAVAGAGCLDREPEYDEEIVIDYGAYDVPAEVYDQWGGTADYHEFVSDPTKNGEAALHVPLEAGVTHAGNSLFDVGDPNWDVDTNGHGMVDALSSSFWLYVPEEFHLSTASTLRFWISAMSHSAGDAHSAGGWPDGSNGWSTRPVLSRQDDSLADGNWHVSEYVYHIDQENGERGDHTEYANVVVEPGWSHWELYVECNTWDGEEANADGVSMCWVDGELAYENDDWRFTTSEANAIEYHGPSVYYWTEEVGSPSHQSLYYEGHEIRLDGPAEPHFDDG